MATDVRKIAQDAAYVTVGVGVLAFQKAQVGRREARARVESQVEQARTQVEQAREQLRSRVAPVAEQVRGRVPERVAGLVEAGRSRLRKATSAA